MSRAKNTALFNEEGTLTPRARRISRKIQALVKPMFVRETKNGRNALRELEYVINLGVGTEMLMAKLRSYGLPKRRKR